MLCTVQGTTETQRHRENPPNVLTFFPCFFSFSVSLCPGGESLQHISVPPSFSPEKLLQTARKRTGTGQLDGLMVDSLP
jgi:hypothetical protein